MTTENQVNEQASDEDIPSSMFNQLRDTDRLKQLIALAHKAETSKAQALKSAQGATE